MLSGDLTGSVIPVLALSTLYGVLKHWHIFFVIAVPGRIHSYNILVYILK